MQILLLCIGIVYSIFGEIVDAIFVFFIIILMVLTEVQNEYRAKKALIELSDSVPKESFVRRGGELVRVNNTEIVVGDILIVSAGTSIFIATLTLGQLIPADARLISSSSLEVNESILTVTSILLRNIKIKGESLPVQKDATITLSEDTILSERLNMAFAGMLLYFNSNVAGTTVTRGKGVAVVTSVLSQNESEMGKIFQLVARANKLNKKTPLQKALKRLAKILTAVAVAVSILIPLIAWLRGLDWHDAILSNL
jgi:Ca2+-transporting ATPase